MLPEIPYML